MRQIWADFICWLTGEHRPIDLVRRRPARVVQICGRCGETLSEDPWDDDQKGPRRAA